MKQVVINLVRNAIEAMPDGGTVEVESGLVDGRALLVVKDTGPGLPEGLDVFQLFVTTKARGTGLGLSDRAADRARARRRDRRRERAGQAAPASR